MNIRDALPVHAPNSDELSGGNTEGGILIGGLVERPQMLSPAELSKLPRIRLVERFVCEEGWAVEDLAWEGVSLRAVLALGRPLPTARYARVYAGNFGVSLAFAELDQALLCDQLNGEPLSREHGAPWRLVVSGGACFTSVKWVSTLDLTAEPGEATAERIARGRIAAERPG
ncbi:MAG TPA: molybdopterin-dependent oxidoreductase [Ktedonobacterales bacterium]|nr:molybdopterin-dependent oxidoreductase [Ktedonobacterales bacterium]